MEELKNESNAFNISFNPRSRLDGINLVATNHMIHLTCYIIVEISLNSISSLKINLDLSALSGTFDLTPSHHTLPHSKPTRQSEAQCPRFASG